MNKERDCQFSKGKAVPRRASSWTLLQGVKLFQVYGLAYYRSTERLKNLKEFAGQVLGLLQDFISLFALKDKVKLRKTYPVM